ncbi:protein SLOW GREEN 1, chloroplastic-like [Chenopodium quinoa]|uniref:Chloroplast lumen common family protein n=1 Tax=Chenopodium quinoa TaxID=63459 RepID=A0A803KW84_CHEQI|nr:protein SLOW GREEN 1, chloroplastic-like [Chenopodium quinoa]
MAFLSTNTFTLNSFTNIPCSKLSSYNVRISKTSNPNSVTFPRNQSLTTACNPKNNPQSPNPTNLITHFLSTHKKIPKTLTENAVKLLVGSLILMGSLSFSSPVSAVQVQSGVNLEEEKETQKENAEDEEKFEKLLEQEPRNVEVLKVVVNLKMRKGKTKKAVKYVERLIDIEPEQVEWRLLQALCCEMMGQLSTAKRLFKEILKENPLLLRALHGLAMVMHKNHEEAAVFDMLNEALKLAVHKKRVAEERNIKILIAQMHLVKGNFDEALKKYGDLIAENPRDFRPYLCQGIIYSLLDKKKEADEQFEIYRNLVPEEFPQRGFLEDVVMAAKTESREQLQKEFNSQFSYKR